MQGDAKEEVRARITIDEVASQYMELKRAGRNFKALSPFSNEKTPSFIISPDKQIWHDFSSGKGGDMFSLVMEMEGVDFRGALEILARRAGVDLTQFAGNKSNAKLKNRLLDALELATKFYQVQFKKSIKSLNYVFKERYFSKDVALKFRFGYSPNNGDALAKFLLGKKFTIDELKRAGLVGERYGRVFDIFRGRLMIPLMDPRGNAIGFTARALDASDTGPKYINTPATLLYDKSRHVFGLDLAKDAIRKNKFVVVVEGNLDVVASHMAGVENVVASAGTAMTKLHFGELQHFCDDIRLCFDQDAAGLLAMERMIPISYEAGVNLCIVTIPSGKDPDELIKKDPKLWAQVINEYEPALDWLILQHFSKVDTSSASGRRALGDAILPIIKNLQDPIVKDFYLKKLAGLIEVDVATLESKMSIAVSQIKRYKKTSAEKLSKTQTDNVRSQQHLLAICLLRPGLREYLTGLRREMFNEEAAQSLLDVLKSQNDLIYDEQSLGDLHSCSEYCKILNVLFEELYSSLAPVELEYEVARLESKVIENYVKNAKTELSQKLREASSNQIDELLVEVKKLDLLLKSAKEKLNAKKF